MTRGRKIRLIATGVVIVALVLVGTLTDVREHMSVDRMRDAVQGAGLWGMLLFVALFALGELVHVPGLVFVFVAILAYGALVGGVLALIGAVIAVTFTFIVIRAVGGRALSEIKRPLLKKMLAHLDQRPVRTVVLLRLVFMMLPALNYALALSSIRFRDYVVGSAVGLGPVILVVSLFFDLIFTYKT